MGVVIDLVTRLPVEIWFQEKPHASDTRFEENLLQLVSAKTLLLLDRGFYHFQFWQRLIAQGIHFTTRIKINAAIEYQQVFTDSYTLRDRLVKIGSGTKKTPFVTLRLIKIRVGKVWRSYLTSVLDPEILPPYVVIDLYQTRLIRVNFVEICFVLRHRLFYVVVSVSAKSACNFLGNPILVDSRPFLSQFLVRSSELP